MRKFFCLTWLLMAASLAIQAQSIAGWVCLESDRSPVAYATVGLVHLPDSSMVTGVTTQNGGEFLLEKIHPGNYLLRVSFIGYKTEQRSLAVRPGDTLTAVDTIFLSESVASIAEIKVIGERLRGRELVDRTRYAIPEAISQTATNGYELLKKIPQVHVDFQNNVTLNGSSSFIIQVDGRERDKEYLARLLPSDIETVEIISNPSGKYEGNIDGVISIILRKGARYGINGHGAINLRPFNRLTSQVTGSLDYSVGKITFYAAGVNRYQALDVGMTDESCFAAIDSAVSITGQGDLVMRMSGLNTGFDYYIDDRNTLSLNVSFKPISQDINLDSDHYLYKNTGLLASLASHSLDGRTSSETSASLFYKKSFSRPERELTVENTGYFFNSALDNRFQTNPGPMNSELGYGSCSRAEKTTSGRSYLSARINYVHPLGMNARLESGYQLYYQQMTYDFTVNDIIGDNLFSYSELRNSAYTGITVNLDKIGMQASLRVESSHISADSVSRPDYACFLPSFNLLYKLSSSHNMKFTYNRRINRPGIYELNPYPKTDQNLNISRGNPDLRPDYRDRLQLTYTWNFGSNYFSPFIYTEFFSDKTGNELRLVTSPENNALISYSRPYNLLSGYETGGGLNANLWDTDFDIRVFKGHINDYQGASFSVPGRDYWSWSLSWSVYVSLGRNRKTTAFAFFDYDGVSMNARSKTYHLPFYGPGIQTRIGSHSLGLVWVLPLSSFVKLDRTVTEMPGFVSGNSMGFDASNYFQFSYSWKFNKGREVHKINRTIEIESDSKENTVVK